MRNTVARHVAYVREEGTVLVGQLSAVMVFADIPTCALRSADRLMQSEFENYNHDIKTSKPRSFLLHFINAVFFPINETMNSVYIVDNTNSRSNNNIQ